jgi:hypothetical protein
MSVVGKNVRLREKAENLGRRNIFFKNPAGYVIFPTTRTLQLNLEHPYERETKMTKRPLSVTIICWFLIIGGGISFITTTVGLMSSTVRDIMAKSPVPINVQYAMIYVALTVSLVCGIAMLKRQNWARFLYIVWSIIGFVFSITTSPMKTAIIPGFVVFLIIAFFLLRPITNEYFRATPAAEHGA